MAEKVITPEAILSYPTLFQPEEFEEGARPAYSCVLVFPPESQATPAFKRMKEQAYAAAVEMFGDKAKEVIQNQRYPTFRSDGIEEKGYPAGSVWFNCRSYRKPQIASTYPNPDTGKAMIITEDMANVIGSKFEIYPGCVVIASIVPVAYNRKGNKGVSFWLNNLQKRAEGERLAGGIPADEEFEADPDAVADLDDLTSEVMVDGPATGTDVEEEKKVPAKKAKAKKKEPEPIDFNDLF